MSLFIGLYDAPGGHLLADYSPIAKGLKFGSNEHGFADLSFLAPVRLSEAFRLYDRPALPHVVAAGRGALAWEGRLEDVTIAAGGLQIQALGYQRAASDAPYTAVWSTKDYAAWRAMTIDDRANTRTEKFEADNNNRIFIAIKKNEVMTANTIGRMGYVAPSGGARYLVTVTFTYDVYLDAGYTAALVSCSGGLGGTATNEWSVAGNGASQTGTVTVTLTNATADALIFQVVCPAATYAGETGDRYLKITSLRIKSTASAAVYADEIARALVAYLNGINGTQLDPVTALIESQGLDLTDEIYLDQYPADILTALIRLGDNAIPPGRWEWGVWENRRLHLRPRGSTARAWYVDASALQIERTIEALRNSVYAVYADGNNVQQRTAVATDADSVVRYGVTRRTAVSAQTTSATQAGVIRDTALADAKDPMPRSSIRFDRLFDASGARWPGWMCRSGDTLTIRNLPPTLSTSLDRVRTFRVSETRYSAETRVLDVTPESALPRLEVLMARLAEGIREGPAARKGK